MLYTKETSQYIQYVISYDYSKYILHFARLCDSHYPVNEHPVNEPTIAKHSINITSIFMLDDKVCIKNRANNMVEWSDSVSCQIIILDDKGCIEIVPTILQNVS